MEKKKQVSIELNFQLFEKYSNILNWDLLVKVTPLIDLYFLWRTGCRLNERLKEMPYGKDSQ